VSSTVEAATPKQIFVDVNHELLVGSVPHTPDPSAFSITGNTITGVTVNHDYFTLYLSTTVLSTDNIWISYDSGTSQPIWSTLSVPLASFTGQAVTNHV
jgi:hypothetical protein